MRKFSRFKKLAKRFYKSLDDHQRRVFNIVSISFVILILGGIVLFFTKDNTPDAGNVIRLTCRDSDGYDPRIKGAVTYTDAQGSHVDEDYCSPGDGAVFEMTCHKTSFWSPSSVPEKKTVPCPKGCVNGACKK